MLTVTSLRSFTVSGSFQMYLHAMPVVSLDYYLPQLMMGINDVSLKSTPAMVSMCW